MSTITSAKVPRLKKAAEAVFGTPSKIDQKSKIYQSFVNVMIFINQ